MKFTFDGNPAAERVIQDHQSLIIATVKQAVPEENLAAIVMIGGYGRSEGAYVIDDRGRAAPYNDYDYFVIYRDVSLAKARALTRMIPDLEHETGIDVDFFPLRLCDLEKLEFSLMNAEMRAGHAVIWGDVNILDRMPDMPLSEVPKQEFQRLLTNRGCLLLMNQLNPASEDFSKFINKAWLAIGDSQLAGEGAYALSYLEKRDAASKVLKDKGLVACYQRAIDIRMRPDACTPWQAEDLPEVIEAWVTELNRIAPGCTEDNASVVDRLKNLLRHLRDTRLPRGDLAVFSHPRKRITNRLAALLRENDAQQVQQEARALLDLWASYS